MTVIVANGEKPKRAEVLSLLKRAEHIVACDGAGTWVGEPHITIGDGDSGICDVMVAEQETNDLAKAYRYCRAQGWGDIVVMGATGLREDHALGNIFRCLEWGVTIASDYGTFVPCEGIIVLKNLRSGQGVSIFATDPATEMTSEGLQWPLKDVSFTSLYCATLNRAIGGDVTLTSTRRVYVYIEA